MKVALEMKLRRRRAPLDTNTKRFLLEKPSDYDFSIARRMLEEYRMDTFAVVRGKKADDEKVTYAKMLPNDHDLQRRIKELFKGPVELHKYDPQKCRIVVESYTA